MKEIIKVEVDRKLKTTEVTMRVPEFENFGQRLGELKRKSTEAVLAVPVDMDGLAKGMAKMQEMIAQSLKNMPDGPAKEAMLQGMKESEEFMKEGLEAPEGDRHEVDPKEFEYDLQQLWADLPPGMKWDKAAEDKVDQFLAEWPKLRPTVLKAMAAYYKEHYADIKEFLGDEPGVEFILPPPGAPEVVADLFRISTIYLRDDGALGLSGDCTWDEEHACGVLLKNGKVIAAGHASDAFS